MKCQATKTFAPKTHQIVCLSRPICPCEMFPAGVAGAVSINGQGYTLAYNAELPEEGQPVIHGYTLTAEKSGKVYDIRAGVSGEYASCDCADFTYRSHRRQDSRCKHLAAVESLLAARDLIAPTVEQGITEDPFYRLGDE